MLQPTELVGLLALLLLAQVDMLIGSFVDVEFGTAYVLKIDEDGYQQVELVYSY